MNQSLADKLLLLYKAKYSKLPSNVWELVLDAFSEKQEKYIIVLKADITIIEALAQGLSPHAISFRLGLSSKSIYEVCRIWGITPLEETLDFNPLLLYNDKITATALMLDINEILAIPITLDTAQIVINNIERYLELKKFLEEIDE